MGCMEGEGGRDATIPLRHFRVSPHQIKECILFEPQCIHVIRIYTISLCTMYSIHCTLHAKYIGNRIARAHVPNATFRINLINYSTILAPRIFCLYFWSVIETTRVRCVMCRMFQLAKCEKNTRYIKPNKIGWHTKYKLSIVWLEEECTHVIRK